MRHCVSRFAFVLALLLLVHLPGVSQAQSIQVLESGWGGTAVPGNWTPVRLRVKAGATELRGVAEVIMEAELQTKANAPALRLPIGSYGHEVTLRSGETRDVTVWFPAQFSVGIRVRL